MTVVLVEDESMTAKMYTIGLEACGFRVVVCESAATLFGQLPDLRPDVIVLDWILPGIDGAHVFARLRQDARIKSVPVLVLSALPQPSRERDLALRAGIAAWLEKKTSPPRVVAEAISKVLGGIAITT